MLRHSRLPAWPMYTYILIYIFPNAACVRVQAWFLLHPRIMHFYSFIPYLLLSQVFVCAREIDIRERERKKERVGTQIYLKKASFAITRTCAKTRWKVVEIWCAIIFLSVDLFIFLQFFRWSAPISSALFYYITAYSPSIGPGVL